MKKLLSIIGAISLITSGSSNLIGCNKTDNNNNNNNNNKLTSKKLAELKAKNSKIINGNKLEWIAPQEKPFNIIDNKWYVVIWRGSKNDNWKIIKFKNNKELIQIPLIDKYWLNKDSSGLQIPQAGIAINWKSWDYDLDFFKAVYRWDGVSEPSILKINPQTGKIIN